jgi:hypothetical protein
VKYFSVKEEDGACTLVDAAGRIACWLVVFAPTLGDASKSLNESAESMWTEGVDGEESLRLTAA